MKHTLQQLNDASKAEGRETFANSLVVVAMCSSLADYAAVNRWLVKQVGGLRKDDRRKLLLDFHNLSRKGIYGIAYTGTAETIFELLLRMWLK